MDEKTEVLIREFAEKFGTTGEHLWEVLVRQAFISGTTDIAVILGWVIILGVSAVFFIVRSRSAGFGKELGGFLWGLWGCVLAVVLLLSGMCMGNIIGALVNPEYWALQQLLP